MLADFYIKNSNIEKSFFIDISWRCLKTLIVLLLQNNDNLVI